ISGGFPMRFLAVLLLAFSVVAAPASAGVIAFLNSPAVLNTVGADAAAECKGSLADIAAEAAKQNIDLVTYKGTDFDAYVAAVKELFNADLSANGNDTLVEAVVGDGDDKV